MDISQRKGGYPVPPQAGPIMGVEFAGIIEQVCKDCNVPFPPGVMLIRQREISKKETRCLAWLMVERMRNTLP